MFQLTNYIVMSSILYYSNFCEHSKKLLQTLSKATQNNLEPMAFSFGGGLGDIVSDNYSFLDQDPDSLLANGNGGMRQMHNYVDLNYADNINTPSDEQNYKSANKIPQELTVEQLQQQREQEFQQIAPKR